MCRELMKATCAASSRGSQRLFCNCRGREAENAARVFCSTQDDCAVDIARAVKDCAVRTTAAIATGETFQSAVMPDAVGAQSEFENRTGASGCTLAHVGVEVALTVDDQIVGEAPIE